MNQRVAIVTGAASGIGRATAQRFARDGLAVIAVDRDEMLLKKLTTEHPTIQPFACDITGGGAPSPDNWGRGANLGFHTLLPYDAQIAKDGTIYAGTGPHVSQDPPGARSWWSSSPATVSP